MTLDYNRDIVRGHCSSAVKCPAENDCVVEGGVQLHGNIDNVRIILTLYLLPQLTVRFRVTVSMCTNDS